MKPTPLPLLPYEKRLAEILDVSPEAYQEFKAEVASRTRIDPAKPIAGGAVLGFVVNLVIGIGTTVLSSLFKPKAPGRGPTIDPRQISGSTRSEAQRRTPRYGFSAVQDIATAGQRYPLVIANREERPDGRTYGAVRVNLLLVWSQMWSLNGSQLFRGLFLLGRANMGSAISPNGFAFGDNSLVSYDYGDTNANNRSARYSLYASTNGGRIVTNDWIGGQNPWYDKANLQAQASGSDVFTYTGIDGAVNDGFCCVAKPSSGTALGLYSPIVNGMAFRVAPRLRPTCTCNIYTRNGGEPYVECDDDTAALAEFWKSKYVWSCRSGMRKRKRSSGDTNTYYPATGSSYTLITVNINDLLTYELSNTSDAETSIRVYDGNTDADNNDSETVLDCADVASSVAGWQREADDAMMIGELYKIGSALAVLEGQNPNIAFVSDADNDPPGGGTKSEYRFRVVRAGTVGFVGSKILNPDDSGDTLIPPFYNREDDMDEITVSQTYRSATDFPQIFKCAIAAFGVTRPTRLIEIGFKFTLGIRINGLTNFKDCPKLRVVNERAGNNRRGNIGDDEKLNPSIFQSGTVTKSETRYQFNTLWYRDGLSGSWTRFPEAIFGFRAASGDPIYGYLRIQFPYVSSNWQIKLEPLSGWEVRTNTGWGGDIIVIDAGYPAGSRTEDGFRISYNGFEIEAGDIDEVFNLRTIDAKEDIGYGFIDDNSMFDAYGRLAEKFCYDNITTTATNGPEVEISYVNIFTANNERADYEDLALIGINIMAGPDLPSLSQASQLVNEGYMMRRLLSSDSYGPTHLWPDVLRELMTNPFLGDGVYISDAQIDRDSFQAAAQWCQDRYYFYDGVIPGPVNILSWAADLGATHLLRLVKRGTRFGLQPALVFGAAVPIAGLFTAGNISEDSFSMTVLPYNERQPITALVKYREQSPSVNSYRAGLFPQDRTIIVQEAGRPNTDPIEDFDLSDYCTSERHAIDAMCHIIRRRRLVDHTISFKTTPEGLTASLSNGDYIKVAYDLINFDLLSHGVITDAGQLVTTRPDLMTPGVHACITWDGSENEPIEQNVTVNSDETASPTGIFFAKRIAGYEVQTYEINDLSLDREGYITIEASHHPCDSSGRSLLAANWTTYATDSNWVIRR